VKTVPDTCGNTAAVALSRSELQEAMSPAPTNVTVVVCPMPGVAASMAVVHASSPASAMEASNRLVFLITPYPFSKGEAL
jgi:hypothetical protein